MAETITTETTKPKITLTKYSYTPKEPAKFTKRSFSIRKKTLKKK